MTNSRLVCPKGHTFYPQYASSTNCPFCAEEDANKPDPNVGKVHSNEYCYRCGKTTLHTMIGPYHRKMYWKCGCGHWTLAEVSIDINMA